MANAAEQRAAVADIKLGEQLTAIHLDSSNEVKAQIRTYLLKVDAEMGTGNNVHKLLKTATSGKVTEIEVGPHFEKGPTGSYFQLESGARLSFGITLREENKRCSLVAYRFQLNIGIASMPGFFRFDLTERAHPNPLSEPRCHLHPGIENVRIPLPPLTPLEVLDRIFLVIEPELAMLQENYNLL